jgi:hypothetical protein
MNKMLLTSIAATFMAASVSSMAVTAKSAPYIGADIGFGAPELSPTTFDDPTGKHNNQSSTSTIGGLAGGGEIGYNYALTDYWLIGAEVGYHRNGEASYNFNGPTLDVTSTDADVLLTGTYLLNSGWNFFGKAGVARLMQDASFSDGPNPAHTDTLTATKPIIKIGLGYLIDLQAAGSINLFAQYGHIFGVNATGTGDLGQKESGHITNTAVATDSITVGATYNLPI